MNRLRAACWCALFWCLSMGGRAEGLSAAWDPAHTWVFTVGILEWKRSDAWVPFPKTNRRDVRWTLAWQKLGVPPAHITYLSDHGATHRAIFDAFADTIRQQRLPASWLVAVLDRLEKAGLRFAGMSPDGLLPETVEYPDHPWFIGVQYHPELKSKPFDPHPLFSSFIAAAIEQSRLV